MDMAQLEQRLTRLEDIEAIKQLKARYCAICDEDHNPDKITTLFIEDGIWEGGMGTAQGHEAIRKLFQSAQQQISFSHHMVMNPLIEIAGHSAKGIWYFLGLFTFREHNEARWLAVHYEDDYVKVDGIWKYKHLRVHRRMNASYEELTDSRRAQDARPPPPPSWRLHILSSHRFDHVRLGRVTFDRFQGHVVAQPLQATD